MIWYNAIDRLMSFELRALALRSVFENATVAAVERAVRRLRPEAGGTGSPPTTDRESDSALAYLVDRQVRIIRDIAIAEHDYAKRLMIALRPLLTEDLFADLWLGFRNSGRTPRVRIIRDNPPRIEFGEPTERLRGVAAPMREGATG